MNMHPQTIYKALEKKELAAAWICGTILIPRDSLVQKFSINFPALLADLQLELGPMAPELTEELDRNRAALLKIFWSAGELASLTGLHPQTIYKAIDEKDIASSRLGTKILVPRDPFLAKFGMNVGVLLQSLRADTSAAA
jgi:excisionase family DNA binding protein